MDNIDYDFYEKPATENLLWSLIKDGFKIFLVVVAIIVVIYFLVSLFSRKTVSKKRPRILARKPYMKLATDAQGIVMYAHMFNPDDPLVLLYNRPDVVVGNKAIKAEVLRRIHNVLNDDDFNDMEMLERIVNINEELNLDDEIAVIAPQVAERIGHNNTATFDARAIDVMRLMDDSQNVHDPTVIKQLNKTMDTYSITGDVQSHEDLRNSFNDTLDRMIHKDEISEERAAFAKRTFEVMLNSAGTCSSYRDRRESEILQTTWGSADTYDKRHNIILGLADAASGGGTVCMNGRIARVLGANTVQASSAELKSAVYSYAGKVMTEGGRFELVENYINDVGGFTDQQRELITAECRAVFDDQDESSDQMEPEELPTVTPPTSIATVQQEPISQISADTTPLPITDVSPAEQNTTQ